MNLQLNKDILDELTRHILKLSITNENYNITLVAKMIQKSSCICRFFNNYYCNEEKIKEIISVIIPRQFKINTHHGIALKLNKNGICKVISTKIKRLFDIVTDPNKKLEEKDLEDSWYNNTTCFLTHNEIKRSKNMNIGDNEIHTLLSAAVRVKNFDKIEQLLKVDIIFNPINALIFNKLAAKRNNVKFDKSIRAIFYSTFPSKNERDRVYYFTIAQLLLEKGMGKMDDYLPSTLLYTIMNDDEEYTLLLLKYGVDPNSIPNSEFDIGLYRFGNMYYEHNINIIDSVGNKKPWFTDMLTNYHKNSS